MSQAAQRGIGRLESRSPEDVPTRFLFLFVLRRPVSTRYATLDSISDNHHEGARGVASNSIYMLMIVADLHFSKGISERQQEEGARRRARSFTAVHSERKQQGGKAQDIEAGS